IYRCVFNEYYTLNERIDFFVFEFHKAKSKGLSFDLFKREVLNELESMRRKIRIPLDKYMLELTLRKNELEREKDFDEVEKIKEEIRSLPYKKGKGLDLYKYSNPDFMGIVPDENIENGFRAVTKKEFKKQQKAKGIKVLPYYGVIYYADIDMIENHLNDAYNQIINEPQPIIKEPQSKVKEIQNPYSEIFKGDDNINFLIFKNYSEKYIIDFYADYSFLFQKMKSKTENRLHNVKHLDFMIWLKNHNYISEKVY